MRLIERVFNISDKPEGENLKELYKKSVTIAWPATIEGALLSIVNSVDTAMVGSLGSASIAAVGLTGQPRMILLILGQALCVGTTALVARRKGADDQRGANECLAMSMLVMTIVGIIMSITGVLLAEPFMRFAGANEDTLALSVEYFRIISMGLLFNCWSLCICAAMRAIGKTRITMVVNIAANLINVCLNYLLIGGNFGFPALGVRGAAIATLCGTIASSFWALAFALKKGGYLRLRLPSLRSFDGQAFRSLLRVGLSSASESVALRLGFLIVSKLIAGVGTAAYASYQIVQQVSSLSFTIGDGIAAAGASLVGQSLGAKRRDLAMANVRITRKLSIFSSIFLMAIIMIFRHQIPLIFTKEADIISGITLALYVVTAGILPQNGRIVYAGCLRGAGDVRYVAVVALLSVMILRPVLTYLFCYPMSGFLPVLQLPITGPWLAFLIDAFVREALLSRRVRNGAWMSIRL